MLISWHLVEDHEEGVVGELGHFGAELGDFGHGVGDGEVVVWDCWGTGGVCEGACPVFVEGFGSGVLLVMVVGDEIWRVVTFEDLDLDY